MGSNIRAFVAFLHGAAFGFVRYPPTQVLSSVEPLLDLCLVIEVKFQFGVPVAWCLCFCSVFLCLGFLRLCVY